MIKIKPLFIPLIIGSLSLFLFILSLFTSKLIFLNPLISSTIDNADKDDILGSFVTEVALASKSASIKISPSPSISPKPSPSTSSFPLPSISPSPFLSPSPSITTQEAFGSEQINGFIDEYASFYGVDANTLRYIAICESDFNPNSLHLSYAGIFQFSSTAWIKYRTLMQEDTNTDLRLNAKEAVKTAAYVLSINEAYIWPNCIPE